MNSSGAGSGSKPNADRAFPKTAAYLSAIVWWITLVYSAERAFSTGQATNQALFLCVLAVLPAWAFIGLNFKFDVFGLSAGATLSPITPVSIDGAANKINGGSGGAAAGGGAGKAHKGLINPAAVTELPTLPVLVTHDPAIDLKSAIEARLTDIAKRLEVSGADKLSASDLLVRLVQLGALTDNQTEGLAPLIRLGAEAQAGATIPPTLQSQVVALTPSILATLDTIRANHPFKVSNGSGTRSVAP